MNISTKNKNPICFKDTHKLFKTVDNYATELETKNSVTIELIGEDTFSLYRGGQEYEVYLTLPDADGIVDLIEFESM